MLLMNFATFADDATNLDASWTASRIMNGTVFRIRLYNTVQLVPSLILGSNGVGPLWSNDQPWANGEPWAYDPTAPVAVNALAGAAAFTVDLAEYGPVLKIGHVIGFTVGDHDGAHMVLDIAYDGDVATVTVEPPLRRSLTTDSRMKFRPKMLAKCVNPSEVATNFTSGRHMTFGGATFVEAMI